LGQEVGCESDAAATSEELVQLADEVALEVAAMAPRYVRREQIPNTVLDERRATFRLELARGVPPKQTRDTGADHMEKWLRAVCLLDQAWIRDDRIRRAAAISRCRSTRCFTFS